MKLKSILSILLFLICHFTNAQKAKTEVVRLQAVVNNGTNVTLTWPAEAYAGKFDIYKRLSQSVEDWGSSYYATVPGNQNFFADVILEGKAFEYMVVKNNASVTDALGYIYAGNKLMEQRQLPGIILLADSNLVVPLASEISRLSADLISEGWIVYILKAGRNEAVTSVKKRIVSLYQNSNIKPASLLILGHVPVPYSGYYSFNGEAIPPDGHIEGSGNHTGAWPADVYYGILEDVFTDTSVNCTSGALPRNYNIVGDGKFDQTKLPVPATLEVGRVDLFNMPAFGKSDTLLTKNYLDRNHAWRTGAWKVKERALISNNFPTINLASTGYSNFTALIGSDSVFDNRDYFPAQKAGSYLWSYGCGAGSYTTCDKVGNTSNFVNDSFENVFTILAGSFFGDWDIQNNLLRAPLASKSLACFWGGIPKWYVHHMGMGERIGKGTMITQNNKGFYFSGNFNSSANSMHIALMGDPSLRMRNLPQLKTLSAKSVNKIVNLNWNGLNDTSISYAVYIVYPETNRYERINEVPTKDTFYNDTKNYYSGNYLYAVKPIKLEVTASGSYFNTGGAAFASVNHVNGLNQLSEDISGMNVYPNPNKGQFSIDFTGHSGNKNIQIFDAMGSLVYHFNTMNKEITVNKADLANGIYFIRVQTEFGVMNSKMIIE